MSRFKLIVVVGMMLTLPAGTARASECIECHSSPMYKVQNPKLFKYYENYRNSVHGIAGISCEDCHGGDTTSRDLELAHAGVMEMVRFDRIPATCGDCHEVQRDNFVESDHYRTLNQDGTAPNCVTCHGAMEVDFIYAGHVKNTCLFCHNLQSGTSPDVPDRAEYVLSKINIIKGYKSFVATNSKDKQLVAEIEADYEELTSYWHNFELTVVTEKTEELLDKLRAAKGQAMKDKRQ